MTTSTPLSRRRHAGATMRTLQCPERGACFRGRAPSAHPVALRHWPISYYAPVRDDPASSVSAGQVSSECALCQCPLSKQVHDATGGGASEFWAALSERSALLPAD